ncbi:MAG TPA: CehA/McbA family metallohydrolase [Anaerolineaceae bacterium]|nr:CehA/McbA family metallohydrolase [Anaerolineaceae bacterium]
MTQDNADNKFRTIQYFVEPKQRGTYFTIPFSMPPDTESFTLRYSYERMRAKEEAVENGVFRSREKVNTIDLGLVRPDGTQAGASGADKTEVTLSETFATPGYQPGALMPGEWGILVGVYRVAEPGVNVTYELSFTPKHRRLLKGDLHMHTIASDGVLTAAELAAVAKSQGLDFIAITDHNQMVAHAGLPRVPGLTIIPGVEWTHYQGHSNFLGLDRAYDEPFFTNTPEEAAKRFASARERGALIIIDHPFDEGCPFLFDLAQLPFDCYEIWNGPMRESNFRAVGTWHAMLVAGKKLPAVGGSDFHKSELFLYPGGPTNCVYSNSAGEMDILEAVRKGRGFVSFAPDGPIVEMYAGDAKLGESVTFAETQEVRITAGNLAAGDTLQVITAAGVAAQWQVGGAGELEVKNHMSAPGFTRVQVLRQFIPNTPAIPALVSNPIYFD